jgi:hypothetical protein
VHLLIFARISPLFRNLLRPIPNLTCLSSPAAREPISVAIVLNLLRKRRVMMADVNVSNVREWWTWCTNETYPCVVRVRGDALAMSMVRKKSDGERNNK